MAEALVKKDAAAWDKMLAKEFQANYASVVGNKKQLLAAIKSNTMKFESMTNSEMKAIVFGDTAIVHGDAALTALAAFDQRKARVVELRFFGGMTEEETAEALGISSDTVLRDWKSAQLWLWRELDLQAKVTKPDRCRSKE